MAVNETRVRRELQEIDEAAIELPRAGDEPPEVPEELAETFALMEQSNTAPKTIRALKWVAAGYSWREAARIMEYNDLSLRQPRHVAERYGILSALAKTDRLVGMQREIAYEGSKSILHQLQTHPEAVSVKDTAIVTGIALDKVANWEGWRNGRSEGQQGFVAELRAIAAEGGSVKLSLEIDGSAQSPDPEYAAVDVTSKGSDER